MEKQMTTSFHSLTLETLKGCDENIGYDNVGGRVKEKYCNKEHLCPICKSKAQTLLDAGRWFLEKLESYRKLHNISDKEPYESITSDIIQLSQDIKLLEDAL